MVWGLKSLEGRATNEKKLKLKIWKKMEKPIKVYIIYKWLLNFKYNMEYKMIQITKSIIDAYVRLYTLCSLQKNETEKL